MRSANFFLCIWFLVAVALSGCSSEPAAPPVPHTKILTDQMIGMSKAEIPVCLGEPAKYFVEDTVETFVYTYGTCTVTLKIAANGKVISATPSFKAAKDYKPDENPQTEDEQCAHVPEVVSCVRWLRR